MFGFFLGGVLGLISFYTYVGVTQRAREKAPRENERRAPGDRRIYAAILIGATILLISVYFLISVSGVLGYGHYVFVTLLDDRIVLAWLLGIGAGWILGDLFFPTKRTKRKRKIQRGGPIFIAGEGETRSLEVEESFSGRLLDLVSSVSFREIVALLVITAILLYILQPGNLAVSIGNVSISTSEQANRKSDPILFQLSKDEATQIYNLEMFPKFAPTIRADIEEFRCTSQDYPERIKSNAASEAIYESIISPLATCVYSAINSGEMRSAIQSHLSPLVETFQEIVHGGSNSTEPTDDLVENIIRPVYAKILNGLDSNSDSFKICERASSKLPETSYRCSDENPCLKDYISASRESSWMRMALAGLLAFQGDTIAGIHELEQGLDNQTGRRNLNYLNLLKWMYRTENYPDHELLEHAENMLSIAINKAEIARLHSCSEMKTRYDTATIRLGNSVAYYLARERVQPDRALKLAKAAYESDIGDWNTADFADTYGFVTMSFAGFLSDPALQQKELQKARHLFDEAIHRLEITIKNYEKLPEKQPIYRSWLRHTWSTYNAHRDQCENLLLKIGSG